MSGDSSWKMYAALVIGSEEFCEYVGRLELGEGGKMYGKEAVHIDEESSSVGVGKAYRRHVVVVRLTQAVEGFGIGWCHHQWRRWRAGHEEGRLDVERVAWSIGSHIGRHADGTRHMEQEDKVEVCIAVAGIVEPLQGGCDKVEERLVLSLLAQHSCQTFGQEQGDSPFYGVIRDSLPHGGGTYAASKTMELPRGPVVPLKR